MKKQVRMEGLLHQILSEEQGTYSHKSNRPCFSFRVLYCLTLHRDIIQNKTIWKQGEKGKHEEMVLAAYKRAAFTTAKLNRNHHMLLFRLDFCFFCVSFVLSRIHTWPQIWRIGKVKVICEEFRCKSL